MKLNRTIKVLMFLVLLAFVAEAALAPAATPVTLKIAWMGASMKVYKAWKDKFEADNPGVTIEYQFIPYAEGHTVYNTMIQGGNTPDLAYLLMGMIQIGRASCRERV